MNTREREEILKVMDALANALRTSDAMLNGAGALGTSAALAAYDALLAEGNASSAGAEARELPLRHKLFCVFAHSSEFNMNVRIPGHIGTMDEVRESVMEKARREGFQGDFKERMVELRWWLVPLYTHPQPAQGEHEQRSCEGSERQGEPESIAYWNALNDANQMCRSAFAVAKRAADGDASANWPALRDQLEASLLRQFAVLYPACFKASHAERIERLSGVSDATAHVASERRPIADDVVLPPLPEPADAMALAAWGPKPDYYTAEQMHAYARAALESALSRGLPAGSDARVTDAMVRRFLAWRLPDSFSPDCHIRFDRDGLKKMANGQHWPIGTNLLTYDEAKAMLEHCLKEDDRG